MKRSYKLLSIMLILMLAIVTLAGCGGTEADPVEPNGEEATVYNIKLAHEEAPDSDEDVYSKEFKRIVEEKSNGQIQVQIFTLGQLGDGTNQAELIQNGAIEMGIICSGPLGALVPETNIFSLHYLLPSDMDKLNAFLNDSEGMDLVNELLVNANLQPINWAHEGFFYWTGNKPLNTPEAVKGFKMRTMAAPLIADSFNAYGANATPVPFAELYSALQLKMVDGQTNPIAVLRDMKYYEVQSHMTDARSDSFVFALFANTGFWADLPDELKATIMESAQEANESYNVLMKASRQEILELVLEKGMTFVEVTDEERAVFAELSVPVWQQYVETCGGRSQELLDLFLAYE